MRESRRLDPRRGPRDERRLDVDPGDVGGAEALHALASPVPGSSRAARRTPLMPYAVQGSTVFNPVTSNGAVSRVATVMALDAAVAAM